MSEHMPPDITPQQRLYRKFSPAFIVHRGPCVVREEVYDDTPGRQLRAWRRKHDVTLRELAAILGVRVVELSGLEFGRYTCDWLALEVRLRSFAAGTVAHG